MSKGDSRKGSGWSGVAPMPLELDEKTELVLNVNASYRQRYQDRCDDAVRAAAEQHTWRVEGEGAPERTGAWTYQVLDAFDGDEAYTCVRLTAYHGDDEELEVPATLADLPVAELGVRALAASRSLRSVKLPDTVRRIGKKCFACDFNLETVVLSDAIDVLDENVFEQCRGIAHVHLPRTLRELPARLLWDSTALRELEIPQAARRVDVRACQFERVEHLTVQSGNELFSTDGACLYSADGTVLLYSLYDMARYSVRPGCKRIAADAFKNSRKLREIDFPEGLEQIDSRAFYHTGLIRVALPEGLHVVGEGAFSRCERLRTVEFPYSLVAIDAEAFAHTALVSAHLHAALERVGSRAFADTEINFANERSFSISSDNPVLFYDQSALYSTATGQRRLVGVLAERANYTIAAGTVEVCPGAFAGRTSLGQVAFPEGLRVIGARAFEGCTKLKRIVLPESLEEVGERAFFESGMRMLKIGPNLTRVGDLAFASAGTNYTSDLSSPGFISVDPQNTRFYVEGQVLCERCDDGDAVVAVEDVCDKLHIPERATAIRDFAFAKVKVRHLYIHENVRYVGVRGFLNIRHIDRLHIRFPHEVDGCSSDEILFSKTEHNARWYVCALRMDSDGLFFDYGAYDAQIVREEDPLDLVKLIVRRLDNPVKLTNAAREAYHAALKRSMVDVMRAIMSEREMRLLDKLADYGYINAGNIQTILEKSAIWRETEATAYLMEMQQQRFAQAEDDDFSF